MTVKRHDFTSAAGYKFYPELIHGRFGLGVREEALDYHSQKQSGKLKALYEFYETLAKDADDKGAFFNTGGVSVQCAEARASKLADALFKKCVELGCITKDELRVFYRETHAQGIVSPLKPGFAELHKNFYDEHKNELQTTFGLDATEMMILGGLTTRDGLVEFKGDLEFGGASVRENSMLLNSNLLADWMAQSRGWESQANQRANP